MCLGIPGKVTRIVDRERALGEVTVSGVSRPVNLSCVIADGGDPTDCVGLWVLVHVGFALSIIDAAEASKMIDALRDLDELDEWTEGAGADTREVITS